MNDVAIRPTEPNATWLDQIQSSIGQGDLRGARQQIDGAREAWPNSRWVRLIDAKLMLAEGSLPAARSKCEGLLRDHRDFAPVCEALATCYAEEENWSKAAELAEAALSHTPSSIQLLRIAKRAALETGDIDQAIRHAKEVLRLGGSSAGLLAELGHLQYSIGKLDEAIKTFEQAIAMGNTAAPVRVNAARAAYQLGRSECAKAHFRAVLDLPAVDPEIRTQTAKWLRRIEWEAAPLQVPGHPTRPPRSPQEELHQLADGRASPGAAHFALHSADSRSAVVTFSGLISLVGMPLANFDKAAADLKMSVIYLCDPQRLLLLNGIPSLGPDYPSTLAALRDMLDRWGIERIYCLGSSAGGYSAIRYGLDIGATRILTGCAPTDLTEGTTRSDGRSNIIAARLRKHVPEMCLNLRKEIEARENPPEIINYYGAEMPQDRMHALNLQGLPTVHLRPLAGVGTHSVMEVLQQTGILSKLLAEFTRDRL